MSDLAKIFASELLCLDELHRRRMLQRLNDDDPALKAAVVATLQRMRREGGGKDADVD